MKTDLFGISIDSLTMEQTVDRIHKAIRENTRIRQVSINAAKFVSMKRNKDLYDSVTSCDIISADGQSVVWASRFLGKYLPCRVAGVDLMQELVKLAHKNKYKCYFFGASEDVIRKVVNLFIRIYGPDLIAGYRNGYFNENEGPVIARQIADSGAQLLFVALNSPAKENFLHDNAEILQKVNFTMGVGGTFDILAGKTKRAPKWMQEIGMEWFYRFLQEPRRMWKRYLVGNSKFIYLVIKEKIKRQFI